ncbi:MAG: GPP34 family phosphoprotein [Kineosporiaceae bacterium]|nr:GPP34 family phosphoprotein [Kineosporiaceae bacterium]
MTLSIPDEVLLLLLDDVRGKVLVDGTALNAALAGAALVELTLDGAIRLTATDEPRAKKGRLVGTGRSARDPRLMALIPRMEGRKPKDAVGRVMSSGFRSPATDLRNSLLEDLVARGVLSQQKGTLLGFIPTTRWPQGHRRDLEDEVLARVRDVLIDEQPPDPRTGALIAILSAVDALPKVFPAANKKALVHRGKQISQGDWAGAAVREALAAIRAAVMIATTVAVTAGATN